MAEAPKLVSLTVDGKAISAPAGTLLIEACKTVGIEVPSFCYYPNLSLQGACRMCLVKIEKMPKLQTACTTVIGEGMNVWALGVENRGVVSTIVPNKQDHLECEECGMCIDICPVGALTSGAYRYKTRPWEMKHVGTTCTHCADGCKTTLGVRRSDTGMEIVRGDNRDKSGINGDFLCIKGRYAFDFAQHENRITQPLIRKDGQLMPATWEEAFEVIGRRFKEVREQHGGQAI